MVRFADIREPRDHRAMDTAPVVDLVLAVLERLAGKHGSAVNTIEHALREVADLRNEIEQVIIELRFAEMSIQTREIDRMVAEGKREAAEALARGRENAPPPENITIIDPHDIDDAGDK